MPEAPILILGGGINGVAIARQLLLNGQSVVLIDRYDLAYGATAYSSRLIHGGLRYLEYAELSLVRESLGERTRLLQLAPQFVAPLRLFIPTQSRIGGALSAMMNFFGFNGKSLNPKPRGAWLVRCGLMMYDLFARSSTLPKHRGHRVGSEGVPEVCPERYRWIASYSDAQIKFPERFVMGMVSDCEALAKEKGLSFEVLTYHEPRREEETIVAEPCLEFPPTQTRTFKPKAVVNATGSWVDTTLRKIKVDSRRLMGGTKGSHLVTYHKGLRESLAEGGIYAEADDGRPVFLLPFGDGCLVGTTDIFFDKDPAEASASDEEIAYLVNVVNQLFPNLGFTHQHVEFHYCGVRPLPHKGDSKNAAAVTRNHILREHSDQPWTMLSIIGGKLTTCRSLAEEVAQWLGERLDFEIIELGRDREFPGTSDCKLLAHANSGSMLPGSDISISTVDAVIENEHVQTLGDLVERRLMLLYEPRLSMRTLRTLADRLVNAKRMDPECVDTEIESCTNRLGKMFGKHVKDNEHDE